MTLIRRETTDWSNAGGIEALTRAKEYGHCGHEENHMLVGLSVAI